MAPTGASYESMQVVKFVAQRKVNQCLGILPLANGGGAYGRRGGAQAVMVPCDHPSSLWEYFPQTGEVLSYFFSPPNENGTVCLTTGWPFLQAGAFDTTEAATDSSTVVVVLNEADDEANFVLTLPNGIEPPPVLKSAIPAHSIQTYLL
uniref:Glycosyl hydrolase family 30 beta sandwich domain-containing protein n=1 Tax=Odontella aurita TaxID=265563 RepID=A0A7S4I161_9STRA|mmetsp:Transcript_18241/g.52692  ORF Transcript_18241/g.52692 Transcript_18241/m.52692 type:complete len:149 (+) Transcript_18241:196-642(+)